MDQPTTEQIDKLKNAVLRAKQASIGFANSTLSTERARALDYYYQRELGTEVEGQSRVVTSDVADTIEWVLPSLMRIFAGGRDICRFEPMGPEDEQSAKQASEYVNYVFTNDNRGFLILYTWFKDALLQRNGVVEVVWDDSREVNPETYIGLSEQEFVHVVNDPDVEIVAHSAQPDPTTPPMMVAAVAIYPMIHDVSVVRRKDMGRCKVYNIPPEEFVISADAISVEDAILVGRAYQRTVSDLVDEGYPREKMESLPASPSGSVARQQDERIARNVLSRGDTFPASMALNDGANKRVDFFRGYIRYDMDGDGIAELLRVNMAADELLDYEPTDVAPFADLTPIPMPHTWVGRSLADQSMDVQLIKSTVLRQMLGNMYASNNARVAVLEGQVNMEDLLTPRPGGAVRVKSVNAITPLPVVPMIGDALGTIEYLDAMREVRTGVTRYSQGTDANTLNKTATGVNLIQNAGAQRIELVARVFAETGVKRLFQLILRCVSKYQQKSRVIKLRNQWTPMDPRMWSNGMDAQVQVGVGTGNREATLASLMNVAAVQEKLITLQKGVQGPWVYPENVYATASRITEASGFKQDELFFTDPATRQPPPPEPPQPSPDKVLDAQVTMATKQIDAETERLRLGIEAKKVDATVGESIARVFIEGQKVAIERAAKDAELALDAERVGIERKVADKPAASTA